MEESLPESTPGPASPDAAETGDGNEEASGLSKRKGLAAPWEEGVTFLGTIDPDGGWSVEERRLTGVPVHAALAEPLRFESFHALIEFCLGRERTAYLGEARTPVGHGGAEEPPVTNGVHPIHVLPDSEKLAAILRRPDAGHFRIDVPWQTRFASIETRPADV